MNDITHDISSYSNRPIEERAHWYTPAAQAYDKARPHYPAELISHVAHLTQLEPHSKILEVGCGPGTATTAFAEFGCSIVCVELNPGFCELARRNHAYPVATGYLSWHNLTHARLPQDTHGVPAALPR
jgi:protein-L-isoaspartate O-methyltransferase